MALYSALVDLLLSWNFIAVVAATAAATFLLKLYRARSFFWRLQKQGLPMPPYSPIWGHMLVITKIVRSLPPLAHNQYIVEAVRREYPHLDSGFYLDFWPFAPPFLVLYSPGLVTQALIERPLAKPAGVTKFLRPIAGEANLITMEGALWRKWRSIFNPGFSAAHLATLVPVVVNEVMIFRDVLNKTAAKGDIFILGPALINLTVDIIGRVTMDHKFNCQAGPNPAIAALRNQIKWTTAGIERNFLEHINFVRPFVLWYNSRQVDRYLSRVFDERYEATQGKNRGKSVTDLAIKAHVADESMQDKDTQFRLDSTFKQLALNQIKLQIFAGHDTTSIAMTMLRHLLARSPEQLERMRAEHDAVLGPDLSVAPVLIASKPQVLNQLPFTVACIKESLRLFPPASAVRQGVPGHSLTELVTDGSSSSSSPLVYPTEHCYVWVSHMACHRSDLWPRADEFVPDRWLVGPDDALFPEPNAWRPFERGPRACIGQELAMMELKIILALTIRDFDIVPAYEEWDRLKGRKNTEALQVLGERAYTTFSGIGHAVDDYPCRVSRHCA